MRFKLRFAYDERLLEAMEAIPRSMRRWDHRIKAWEFEGEVIFDLARIVKPYLPKLTEILLNSDRYAAYRREARIRDHALASSIKAEADIDIPAPEGLVYFGYQKAGIRYLKTIDKALCADEMGLGKTIQAIGTVNIKGDRLVLCSCVASIKLTWKDEAEKWLCGDFTVTVIQEPNKYRKGKKYPDLSKGKHFIIVSDDSLDGHMDFLYSQPWDRYIADEAHRIRNYRVKYDRQGKVKSTVGSRRAKAAFKLIDKIPAVIGLTGTPLGKHPLDLWAFAHAFAKPHFPSYWEYAGKYCGATQENGWDTSGIYNLRELQIECRKAFMLRRTKKQVLPDLPRRTRQLIRLNVPAAVRKRDRAADWKKEIESLVDASDWGTIWEMAQIRRETAIQKVSDTAGFVSNLLEQTQKVIVAVHHREALDGLYDLLSQSYAINIIRGGMSDKQQHREKEVFQQDPDYRVMLLSMQAGGLGLTLTAAHIMVYHEMGISAETMMQVGDRIHRIGQEFPVTEYYLVYDGSIDAYLGQLYLRKLSIIKEALDY